MIAFFLSLLHKPESSFAFRPKIITVAKAFGHPIKIVFSTTSANTAFVAKPLAIGLIEVTAEELSTIDQDNQIWAFDLTGWKTRLVSDIQVGARGRLQSFLIDRQLSPDVQLTDTIEVAFQKLFASMPDNSLQSVEAMIQIYQTRYGEMGL